MWFQASRYRWHQVPLLHVQNLAQAGSCQKECGVCAGLYDCWRDGAHAEPLYSCTILTTAASTRFQQLHDRMPVILADKAACQAWLHSSHDELSAKSLTKFHEICQPYSNSNLLWHPVTTSVNKASYKEADCAKEVKRSNIASFFSPVKRKREPDDNKSTRAATPTVENDPDEPTVKSDPDKPTVKNDLDEGSSAALKRERLD
jgi:hypothetical protein